MFRNLSSFKTLEQEEVSSYFNPNWQQAKNHGQASKVGFQSNSQDAKRCPCCFQQIKKTPIPFCQNTKQLEVLGFGFPLYFAFLRNCIFLLVVTIFSYNLIAIFRSFKANRQYCQNLSKPQENKHLQYINSISIQSHLKQQLMQNKENKDLIRHYNIASKAFQLLQKQYQDKRCTKLFVKIAKVSRIVEIEQDLIRGGSIIINILLLIYLRDKFLKLKEYFDQRNTSPSDFSILVRQMPKNQLKMKQKLKNKIQRQYQINSKEDIVDVILIPDLDQYQKMQQQKHHLLQQLRKKHQKNHQQDHQSRIIEDKLKNLQKKIELFIEESKQKYRNDQINADRAIIIMQTQPKAKQLLEKHQNQGFKQPGWNKIKMQTAPQPRQIIWQNISLNSKKQKSLILLGWGLSILLLVILTLLFALFSKHKSIVVQQLLEKYEQDKVKYAGNYFKALFIVFGIIFLVVLFNKLLISTLFHKFTDLQRHSSNYKFQFSFCLKYCLGLFFTTALMTLIVQAFMLRNYYTHDYGVIQQQSIMFMVNSFFVPLFWLINPPYLLGKFKRWRSFGKKNFTQHEANHIMEMPAYDIGKRYGQILQIMWFTYLYLTLIPVGAFFSVIGLFLYYWIDKYNLLRRSTLHSQVSGELVSLTLSMLDFTLVLRTVGELVFDSQIRNGITPFSYVFLAIALIYQISPISMLIQWVNPQRFNDQQTPYSEASKKFRQNYYHYHLLHPEKDGKNSKLPSRHIIQQSYASNILNNTIPVKNFQLNNNNPLTQTSDFGRFAVFQNRAQSIAPKILMSQNTSPVIQNQLKADQYVNTVKAPYSRQTSGQSTSVNFNYMNSPGVLTYQNSPINKILTYPNAGYHINLQRL